MVLSPLQVREGRILQTSQEELRSRKLSPNTKKERIKTILHQFRNKHARALISVTEVTRIEFGRNDIFLSIAHDLPVKANGQIG